VDQALHGGVIAVICAKSAPGKTAARNYALSNHYIFVTFV
jgi:hypothetical protein